jgi:hypothetical protein
LFGDPAPGNPKILIFTYHYGNPNTLEKIQNALELEEEEENLADME